jgi:hypothetical protein
MHMCVVTEKDKRIVKNLVEVVGGSAWGWGALGVSRIWLTWVDLYLSRLTYLALV